MSRYRFEPSSGVSGRYRDMATGRFIEAATVRRELDRYLDANDDAARALARALRNHEVSLADWELGMRRIIKNTHLNAIALERGGWSNLTPRDFGRAGQIIREQYGYLRDFAKEIERGVTGAPGKIQRLDGTLDWRANLYSEAGRNTFYRSMHANMKVEITHVQSVLHARDNCRECLELAGRWFRIGDPAYKLPGNRLCLHNCRCSENFAALGAAGEMVEMGAA